MKLVSLNFSENFFRQTREDNSLRGEAVFEGEGGKVTYKLSGVQSQKILAICADGLREACEEQAKAIQNAIMIEVKRKLATEIGNNLPSEY